MTIANTPLGTEEGEFLLDGLDVYSVPAKDDMHPLTVYGINSSKPKAEDNILLMLHGRTWSSVPVYHLMGGPKHEEQGYESRSLMELLSDNDIQAYAMDFRGFGGTPKDSKGFVEPYRCVEDLESVLAWIIARHETTPERINLSLMGWSQGALVAQLAAQRSHPLFSKLILYGSIYDPMVRYPRAPLYALNKPEEQDVANTHDAAVEDFTIEGSIPPETASKFAEAALLSDPIRAKWNSLYQFNTCDPARVHLPTLVVSQNQIFIFDTIFCSNANVFFVFVYKFVNVGLDCRRSRSICTTACSARIIFQFSSRIRSYPKYFGRRRSCGASTSR